MIYILLSIVSSALIFAIFKFFGKNNIDNLQAIVTNYIVAAVFGFVFIEEPMAVIFDKPYLSYALLCGCLFISLFFIMALTAQKISVSVSSVSTKMSLVIPVLYFLIFYNNETASIFKITGIVLALIGVYFAIAPSKANKIDGKLYLLPLIIFIGSGILDILLAYTESNFLSLPSDQTIFTAIPFATAAFFGSIFITYKIIFEKEKIRLKNIFGGLILGIVNYGSIFFLIKSFATNLFQKSAIIPLNNISIVIVSALFGWIIFKEKLSAKNLLGIFLCLVSIILLAIF
jgi:drug/metabolite transporter (DMT)-like permease